MSDHPNGQPKFSSPVRMVDGYFDRLSVKSSVEASTTLAVAIGSTLATTDVGVTIVSDGTVQYNPDGAATASSGFLPTVYTVHGGKSRLDLVQLFAAAATDVSFIVFEAFTGV